jgi:SAM-dependent methyltransferase
MSVKDSCPSCGSKALTVFYRAENSPVHSAHILRTHAQALNYPRSEVVLAHCETCSFITNIAFDSGFQNYTVGYEATQSFSPTFASFHQRLAMDLISRFDLHGKRIIEIGCGQGEFLALLCELGRNRGVGFDPAYSPARSRFGARDDLLFIADFFSEKYCLYQPDFVCCKMTLEHIPNVAEFISMVRNSLDNNSRTTVFFQVPDAARVLRDLAFWDVYYEHCSYFGLGSLARLFRRVGFDVKHLTRAYSEQYLMLAAQSYHEDDAQGEDKDDRERMAQLVRHFSENCGRKIARWREELREFRQKGSRVVLWGAGSKAVAFLSTLRVFQEIEYAVDVNPYKHDTYLAGTGQKVVPPAFLKEYRPDVVIVMNPIYRDEVGARLSQLGVPARLLVA